MRHPNCMWEADFASDCSFLLVLTLVNNSLCPRYLTHWCPCGRFQWSFWLIGCRLPCSGCSPSPAPLFFSFHLFNADPSCVFKIICCQEKCEQWTSCSNSHFDRLRLFDIVPRLIDWLTKVCFLQRKTVCLIIRSSSAFGIIYWNYLLHEIYLGLSNCSAT